jgi:hypothetical protein
MTATHPCYICKEPIPDGAKPIAALFDGSLVGSWQARFEEDRAIGQDTPDDFLEVDAVEVGHV